MAPATWPRDDAAATRLLVLDASAGAWLDTRADQIARLLRPHDVLVVNDAATLPASLAGWALGSALEIRLAGPPDGDDGQEWPAALLGSGSWRQLTEDRALPPRLKRGDIVSMNGLSAQVVRVSPLSPRLVFLRFDREGAALWQALFRVGRPVQYSYLRGALPLWHVQTPYAGRPMAAEMPSAGRPLRLPLLRALRARGVRLASVTHAAGLSSTGDPAIDAALPLPERSELGQPAVDAVSKARAKGGRVVAVGTSVVRALESAWDETEGRLRAGARLATLRVGPSFVPRVVDGLLTGIHEPGESHFELLQAFAPRPLLEESLRHAASSGYLGHEFGDSCLILPGSACAGGRRRIQGWPGLRATREGPPSHLLGGPFAERPLAGGRATSLPS